MSQKVSQDIDEENLKELEELEKLSRLETYGEKPKMESEIKKENVLSRLWNKSVFPDMITEKKKEKQLKRDIAREAKIQAIKEMRPALVEIYKQKELERMGVKKKKGSKPKKSFGEKMKTGFSMEGLGTDDQMKKMLGNTGSSDHEDKISMMLGNSQEGINTEDKINKALGINNDKPKGKKTSGKKKSGKKTSKSKGTPKEDNDFEEKIKRMLG